MKENLSEEEAYVYVIETNLMQRSFTDMLPSEKAAVLAERYDKVVCQGKRNDILEEIAKLEGKEVEQTCGHSEHRLKSRDAIGKEYELSGSSVARLLRVNELIPELREWLDTGKLNFMAAVQLSYVSEEIQKTVYNLGKPINKEMAVKLRQEGITVSDVIDIVCGARKAPGTSSKSVKIPAELFEKYFKGVDTGAVESIVAKALEAWFRKSDAKV